MSRPLLMIVEDDMAFASKLAGALEGLFGVEVCHSEQEFRDRFAVGRFDLLIMDIRLRREREGLDILKEALAQDPLQAAIVMTAYADASSYADAIATGAITYLDKRDFSPALIARTVEAIVGQSILRRRLVSVEERLEVREPLEIIGTSPGIKAVGEAVRRAAEGGANPIVIIGEPGSGRGLAARNIHRLGRRGSEGAFVYAVCGRAHGRDASAALFGVYHGLDGDARVDSRGWIDAAKGGVLYLDGLGAMDPETVSRLAQLIETGHFTRMGGAERMEADAQVILSVVEPTSATEDRLRATARSRGGSELHVPPLRERREDIPLLAQYTLQRLYRQGRTQARSFRGAALAAFEAQSWHGNVRELIAATDFAAVRADATGSREIGAEHLPRLDAIGPALRAEGGEPLDYKVNLARAELGLVESAIERFESTKKEELSARLYYNDRFAFSRRLRKVLDTYPRLRAEFPRAAEMFPEYGGTGRNAEGGRGTGSGGAAK
jgi:DNA-binding NtrC family response regulator